MTTGAPRLFLFDGMALAYRSHFAFIRNPRLTAKGFNTSAILGYVTTILDVISEYQPTHLAVAFDTPEPTQRHRDFPEYKAQRQAIPEDLLTALPHLDRVSAAFRIPVLRCPGYEADDVIGTLARRAEAAGFSSYLITPDKDFSQLVSEHVTLLKPSRQGGLDALGPAEILKDWEITSVAQVTDVLGLWGDASDNIPGVPGIGEKTAKKLVAQFGSVEGVLAHADQLTGKLRQNVEANRDQALLSKRLVTINTAAPVPVTLEALACQEPDYPEVRRLFQEFEFTGLARRVLGEPLFPSAGAAPAAPAATRAADGPAPSEQLELFATGTTTAPPYPPATDSPGAGVVPRRTSRDVPHNYRLVQTPEDVAALVAQLAQQPAFCLDLETTSLDEKAAAIVGIAFSWTPHQGYYVAFPPDEESARRLLNQLLPVLTDPRSEKVGHNLKFDLGVLGWYGVAVAGPLFDTMVAHALVAPEMRHGMDYLAQVYLDYDPIPIEALIGSERGKQKNMRDVPPADVAEYSAEDADVTWQLRTVLTPMLQQFGVERVFREIEMPLLPVLVDLEREGFAINAAQLREYSAELARELADLEQDIYRLAGLHFNLDSPKQLGEVLFEHLHLDPQAKRTAKTGQYITSEDVLAILAPRHPVVRRMLEFRELRKLKSTYVDVLPDAVCPRTGRVHTSFSQVLAVTGRLASHDPNLQNIPVRTAKGKEIRKAFVPRGPEYLLLAADYSQIELRVIAELSGDPAMNEVFRQGQDIHRLTAARIYHLEPAQVTEEMRRRAKVANFGIAYGISAFGLAQRLEIPRHEAGALIEEYYRQFPGVKGYVDRTIAFARDHGYVETVTGRRRYLRDINSRNTTQRGAAERNAINMPIQGTAADMIKIAMARIQQRLRAGDFRTRMLLQVHDELVFDLYREEEAALKPLIAAEMAQAIPMKVPIVVDIGVGTNWLEAH